MSNGNPEEVTRFVFLNLVNSDINQQVTDYPLILTILNCLIHGPLEARIIRLLAYLVTIFAGDSSSSRRIVIEVSNIKARGSRELTQPVLRRLSSATDEKRAHGNCENSFIHYYSLIFGEFFL